MFLFLGIGCLLFVYLACKYDEFGWRGIIIGVALISLFCASFFILYKTLKWELGYYLILGAIGLAGVAYLIWFFHETISHAVYNRKKRKNSACTDEQNFEDESQTTQNKKYNELIVVSDISVRQYQNSDVESVFVENGVTRIDDYAFCGCLNLKTVRLPKTLKYVSDSAFLNCSEITDFIIESDFSASINISSCHNIGVNTLLLILWHLRDINGNEEKYIALGDENLSKLTNSQKQIAIQKGWILK